MLPVANERSSRELVPGPSSSLDSAGARGSVRVLGTHKPRSKVALREQRIVTAAEESQVGCRGLTPSRERIAVMQLEIPALAAALAIRADERTLRAAALVHLANHGAWDVARLELASTHPEIVRARLPRCSNLSEAPLQGFVDQQVYGPLHDRGQVPVRHLVTQQVLELLQLVMQSLARCELEFVSTGPERR